MSRATERTPNRWHQPLAGDEKGSGGHWMCLFFDVEVQTNGRWKATSLYRSADFDRAFGSREFDSADAAMRAVDAWCDEQW